MSITGAVDATGPSARFNNPTSIVSDGTNIYVADRNNHAIRKIVIATGAVSTFAGQLGVPGSNDGTGSNARFYSPESIAIDAAGNLYVGDHGTYRIRRSDWLRFRARFSRRSPQPPRSL